MANLKDISTVPELEALVGTEKVLLNVDGSARQARVDLIKPKEEWDLDITIDVTWNTENSAQNEPVFTVNEGYSYESFAAKFESGEIPKVKYQWNFAMSEQKSFISRGKDTEVGKFLQDGVVQGYMFSIWFAFQAMSIPCLLLPDGTFTLNV